MENGGSPFLHSLLHQIEGLSVDDRRPSVIHSDRRQSADAGPAPDQGTSIDGLMVPMIEYLVKYFNIARRGVNVGTRLRLLPAHLSEMLTKFNEGGEAFTAFDRGRLGTIAQYIVVEKPR